MYKLCCLALFSFTPLTGMAQTTDNQPKTYFSRSEAIPKSRRILFRYLQAGQIENAKQTYRYLDSLTTDVYSPFRFYDALGISILTGNFAEVSEKAKAMDEAKHKAYLRKIRPRYDSLIGLLADTITVRRKVIEENIQQSGLDPEVADFVLLTVAMFQTDETTTHLNELCTQFLAKHPASPHDYYIRHFYRMIWKPTAAFEMGFLFGGNGLTHTLGSNFATYPSVGLFLGGGYGRFELHTMFTAGGGKTKRKIQYPGGTLPEHADYNMGEAKFLLCYKLFPNYPLSLTPLAGAGILQIGPLGKDYQGKEKVINKAKLNSASVICIGAEMDVNINATRSTRSEGRYAHSFLVLGLQYMYSLVRFSNPYIPTNGGIHSLTLKLGFGTEAYRRVY